MFLLDLVGTRYFFYVVPISKTLEVWGCLSICSDCKWPDKTVTGVLTMTVSAVLLIFLSVCVVFSRAHVHCGAGRRAGSNPAATHLSHLTLQMLQD